METILSFRQEPQCRSAFKAGRLAPPSGKAATPLDATLRRTVRGSGKFAVERGAMNLEQLGNLAHGMTLCDQPTTEGHLVGGKRGRAAEAHAFLLCRNAPGAGAAQDQRPFELGGMRCTAY